MKITILYLTWDREIGIIDFGIKITVDVSRLGKYMDLEMLKIWSMKNTNDRAIIVYFGIYRVRYNQQSSTK